MQRLAAYGGDVIARGAIAGFAAGIAFILIEMGWATRAGMPAVAPFGAISSIFYGADQAQTAPPDLIVGLVTHTGLSILFGIGFALLVAALAPVRTANALVVAAAGIVYGLLLYVVNFQIFANLFVPVFASPQTDHVFQIWAHAVYGFLLVPFFLGFARRLWPDERELPRAR